MSCTTIFGLSKNNGNFNLSLSKKCNGDYVVTVFRVRMGNTHVAISGKGRDKNKITAMRKAIVAYRKRYSDIYGHSTKSPFYKNTNEPADRPPAAVYTPKQ